MVQFPALGLEIPEDHPDRSRYISIKSRKSQMNAADLAEITLMGRGDIVFLYTDGVSAGTAEQECAKLEAVMGDPYREPARDICNALLQHAVKVARIPGREDLLVAVARLVETLVPGPPLAN